MNSYVLTNIVVVADFYERTLALIAKILRSHTYDSTWENAVIFADSRPAINHYRGHYLGSRTDFHVFANNGEGTYLNILANFRMGMNYSTRMDQLKSPL
jgi:hypothetical protein